MIHGIYMKSRPKNKWHLVSYTLSPEVAQNEMDEYMKQAILEGNEQAQVAVQLFDSLFLMPDFISEITEQKLLFN